MENNPGIEKCINKILADAFAKNAENPETIINNETHPNMKYIQTIGKRNGCFECEGEGYNNSKKCGQYKASITKKDMKY